MRKALRYVRSDQWVVIAAVVAAIFAEAPALAELLDGKINDAGGEATPTGLLLVALGFLARSKIWSKRIATGASETAVDYGEQLQQARSDLATLRAELQAQRGRDLAATEVLEAVRQGLPFPGVHMPEQPTQPDEFA